MVDKDFKALGKKIAQMSELDTFEAPERCQLVRMISDEVTALCPVTGQPDFYMVEIEYVPDKLCIESKSLKLYLQSFREKGHFCEAFACLIAEKVEETINPFKAEVTVTQKSRGGISIIARSSCNRAFDEMADAMLEQEQKVFEHEMNIPSLGDFVDKEIVAN